MKIINSNLKFNGYLDNSNVPKKIILHNADASTCTVQDVHSWHLNNGWSGIGYHYFVRKDGSIYRGRPENSVGAHCPGYNKTSIAICAEGKYMVETMPEAQKQAIEELIKDIFKRYGKLDIYGHRELYATQCPGTNFPLSFFKDSNNDLKGGEFMSKVYKNGSTVENVYQTSKCLDKIGSLNKFETCECLGVVDGKAIVLYDSFNCKKVGFVKYLDGIQE